MLFYCPPLLKHMNITGRLLHHCVASSFYVPLYSPLALPYSCYFESCLGNKSWWTLHRLHHNLNITQPTSPCPPMVSVSRIHSCPAPLLCRSCAQAAAVCSSLALGSPHHILFVFIPWQQPHNWFLGTGITRRWATQTRKGL